MAFGFLRSLRAKVIATFVAKSPIFSSLGVSITISGTSVSSNSPKLLAFSKAQLIISLMAFFILKAVIGLLGEIIEIRIVP